MQLYFKDLVIIPDNDRVYFSLLEAVINSVDELSIGEVVKTPSHYLFRVSPSLSTITNSLVTSLNDFHNSLSLKVEYSKSMKKSCNISWKLEI
jgi:hypothetical protein